MDSHPVPVRDDSQYHHMQAEKVHPPGAELSKARNTVRQGPHKMDFHKKKFNQYYPKLQIYLGGILFRLTEVDFDVFICHLVKWLPPSIIVDTPQIRHVIMYHGAPWVLTGLVQELVTNGNSWYKVDIW